MDEIATKRKARLDPEVQMLLGDKLRASYEQVVPDKFPARFVHLLKRFSNDGMTLPDTTNQEPARDAAREEAFDPEVLAIMDAAFAEAWATLKDIDRETVAREALARRIILLAAGGERDSSRLATKALIFVIAGG